MKESFWKSQVYARLWFQTLFQYICFYPENSIVFWLQLWVLDFNHHHEVIKLVRLTVSARFVLPHAVRRQQFKHLSNSVKSQLWKIGCFWNLNPFVAEFLWPSSKSGYHFCRGIYIHQRVLSCLKCVIVWLWSKMGCLCFFVAEQEGFVRWTVLFIL